MILATAFGRAVNALGHWFRRTSHQAAIIITLAICTTHAEAAIVSTSGSVVEIAAPASVVLGALEHDMAVRFFLERGALSLPSNLAVDVTQPGIVDSASDLTPGQIPAGTTVNSYLLHADPVGPGFPVKQYEGSITFDVPILGAIVNARQLNAGDLVVGSPTTIYVPRDPDSGFEGPGFPISGASVSDLLALSPDLRTISFHLRVESRLDQIRIITAAVPEPSSAFLLIVACLLATQWARGMRR
jgi:hypothetical protein